MLGTLGILGLGVLGLWYFGLGCSEFGCFEAEPKVPLPEYRIAFEMNKYQKVV